MVSQNRRVVVSTCEKVYRKKDAAEYLAMRTTGSQSVDPRCNNTIFKMFNNPRERKESKPEEEDNKEEELNNPSELLKHAYLNMAEEEGVASRI